MSKITIELAPEQIKEAFEKLPTKEKIRLVGEFERETREERWDVLVSRIRLRFRKTPISQKEINRICEEVRKDLYEKRAKSTN